MSRKQRKHLRGKRGEAFLRIVRGVDRARILCVSLDISKYFHVVMMHNAYGEIVIASFEIDIFRSGFEHLCRVIDETAAFVLSTRPRTDAFPRFTQGMNHCKPAVGWSLLSEVEGQRLVQILCIQSLS
jgi:hypothetical protein